MLSQCASGFGALAFASLFAEQQAGAGSVGARNPLATRSPHYAPRAKSVIFLYMDGGPSQVDTFDYKPLLAKYDGQNPHEVIGDLAPTQFDAIGTVLASPWEFSQHGECGQWVSELFPHLAGVVDDLAFVKSMVSNFSEHTNANFFLHTGVGLQGRPSMGAWTGYALGTENENVPGFVVLNGGLIPPGGLDNFHSGFLPASYQASVFGTASEPLPNLEAREADARLQQRKLQLARDLDRGLLGRLGPSDAVESAIANAELAARMQLEVPALLDISRESQATKRAYGLEADYDNTKVFGRMCLTARRLVERGVRFVEVTCPAGNGDRWDQHGSLIDGHEKNSRTVDQPIAALIKDLKSRGLLDETLVLWGGEFGRTPFAQNTDGRDHNPTAFTMWMAGGGVRGGVSYGRSDEWGYRVAEDKVEIHDLHATILHLLGIDHEKLTYRYSGRDIRLTDVYGHVLDSILV